MNEHVFLFLCACVNIYMHVPLTNCETKKELTTQVKQNNLKNVPKKSQNGEEEEGQPNKYKPQNGEKVNEGGK